MTETTIHKDMTIEDILGMFPTKAQKLAQEITNAGLHCIGCGAATYETLEMGMLGHGKTEDEIVKLLDKLNALLQEAEAERDMKAISMTPNAAKKFIEILKEDGKEGYGLRFGDRLAGCSGFEYVLDYSEKALEDDQVFHSHGVDIHVNNKQANRLMGCIIDFVDGLQGSGFKISNPNAKTSCGCGTSHNY